MRISAVVALLVVVGFAGCIGDDTTTGTDSVEAEEDPQAKYKAAEPNTEMPEREFEGEVVLTSSVLEAAPESNLNFTMDVTDLHDYDFPLTFIDWALFYNRAPNPVAEGDATDLEASYNHTFYAEDYHMFGFRADDGQGFKDLEIVIIQIGEPENPYPNATQIQEFRNRTEEYFQQAEEEVEEVEEEVEEVEVPASAGFRSETYYVPGDCAGCEGGTAAACAGFVQSINYVDCAWVEIQSHAWGKPFTVSSIKDVDGSAGDVDVEFFTACDATGESVSSDYWNQDLDYGPVTGTIPEGATCMVAADYAWPSIGGWQYTFEWEEDPGAPFEGAFQTIPTTPNSDGPCSAGSDCPPSSCEGLATNWNGQGCAWIHVTSAMWGQAADIITTGDADAKALSECSPEAEVLESFGAFGPELGRVIPEGTGCLMAFEFTGNPSVMTFSVPAA